MLKLAAGHLALFNVEYLVTDSELAVEDLLLDLPVLRHLGVETKVLLEEHWNRLNCNDCLSLQLPNRSGAGGCLSRFMIARLNHVSNNAAVVLNDNSITCNEFPSVNTRQTSVDYYHMCNEQEPFSDGSTSDQLDADQPDDIETSISDMLTESVENGLPPELYTELHDLFSGNTNVFRFPFSAPPAKVEPLKIELTPDAKQVQVRLRNCS